MERFPDVHTIEVGIGVGDGVEVGVTVPPVTGVRAIVPVGVDFPAEVEPLAVVPESPGGVSCNGTDEFPGVRPNIRD